MKNDYDYSTAADYARLTGYHPSTILGWIKEGKIITVNKREKSMKKNRYVHWKIAKKSFHPKSVSLLEKPYPKHYKRWNKAEIYILKNNMDKSNDVLAEMLKRSKGSIAVKKCRIRKLEK